MNDLHHTQLTLDSLLQAVAIPSPATSGPTPFPDAPLPGRLPGGIDEITALHHLIGRRDSPFELKEFRLSSSDPETCFRKQVYPFLLGHPGTPPPIQVLRIMASGHVFEHWLVSLFQIAFPSVETQRVVPVPHLRASGHIDIFFPETGHLTEVKYVDVDELSELPKRAHLYQVQSYRHFDKAIRSSHLLYGVRGSCELIGFDVQPNPEIGEEIEANLRMMNHHVDRGTLPDRVNHTPTEFPCTYKKTDFSGTYTVYCPYYQECWQTVLPEHTPADAPAITPISAKQIDALHQLIQIETGLTDINRKIKTIKTTRDRLRDQVSAILPPNTPLHFQGHIVKQTVSEPIVRYDIEKAILAGVVQLSKLKPFQTFSDPRTRWTVKEAPRTIKVVNGTKKKPLTMTPI